MWQTRIVCVVFFFCMGRGRQLSPKEVSQRPTTAVKWEAPKPGIETADTDACNGVCQGRSICTKSTNNSKAFCFCPPGLKGVYCDEEEDTLPIDCVNPRCKNRGLCVQGLDSAKCLCQPNYVGSDCSRVGAKVLVTMNLFKNGKPFQDSDASNSNESLKAMACQSIKNAIQSGENRHIAASYIDCLMEAKNVSKMNSTKSIRVTLQVTFDPAFNASLFESASIRRHLFSATPIADTMGFDAKNDNSWTVEDFDYCLRGEHDCSPSATCENMGTTFTCSCGKFYSDGVAGFNHLPGRYCYYSFGAGFLVGCLVMLPIILGTLVVFFVYRRYQARKAWIVAGTDDSLKLVETQYPKYSL